MLKTFTDQFNLLKDHEKKEYLSKLEACILGKNPFSKNEGIYQCPHCQSKKIRKHGYYKMTQKYKCNICNKEFRASTNTSAYYSKKPERIKSYLECMLRGYTITDTANSLKIARHLAFQWRHKILESLASFQANEIMNEATLTIEDFDYSTKGLDKRKKAYKQPSHLYKKMLKVTFINNQEGDVRLSVHNFSTILPNKLKRQTYDLIKKTRIIHYKPQNSLSRSLRNTSAQLSRESNIEKIKEKQHITSNMTKRWLTKFRGIASKYLQHYLNWFVFLRCYESPRQSLVKTNMYIHNSLDIYMEYKKHRDLHAFIII